jgi:hypothetical protein
VERMKGVLYIKRGKKNWLIYRDGRGCRILPILVTVSPEEAMKQAAELWPGEKILCDEPATEGFYGK